MGLGDMMSGVFGSKNEFSAQPTKLDPNAYQYGGDHGGTEAADANRYRGLAEGAQNRQGAQINTQQADAARAQQANAMGLQAQAAAGNAPSAAAAQQQQGLDAAMKSQYAMAGSARGPGALATAQYGAAQNAAGMQQASVSQAAQLRAQEMAQARDSYAQQAGAMRTQDLGGATSQAQLNAQQGSANDAYSLAQYQNEQAVRAAGMKGAMAQQAQQSSNQQAADQINSGVASQNAAQNNSNGGSLLSAAGSIAGMAAMSDERQKMAITPEIYDAPTVSSAPTGGPTPYVPPQDKKGNYGFAGNFQQEKGGMGGLEKGMSSAGGVTANEGGPKSGEGAAALMPMLKGLMGGGGSAPPTASQSNSLGSAQMGADFGGDAGAGAAGDATASGMGEGLAEGMMSDRTRKSGEHPQGAAPAQMLDHLRPYSFHYKAGVPGEDPSAKRYGIMAQDLEKTPMGDSVVLDTPKGKMIDTKHATGVLFAGLANINDRLRELETKKSGKAAR